MSLRKTILITLFLLVFQTLALADQVDFTFLGGSWSWSGGSGSTLAATSTDIFASPVGGGSQIQLSGITFTTGGASAGSGDVLARFASGGTIMVTGDGTGGALNCGGPCFVGTFTGAGIALATDVGLSLTGTSISGTFSPILLAALGFDTALTGGQGSLVTLLLGENISFEGGGSGELGSGNLIASPIPEPASLTLLGTGLIGLVGALRRKIRS